MASNMVGAFDAKTHFSRLLKRVARGESITITHHGTPVARLVPAAATPSEADKAALLARFKAFAQRHAMSGPALKALREEGRR
ncbi:MAG TPA: type II toxin-antitoxin system prevent-host-death family antitoxin [Stellaceae bacterium]|nr:type II toxin-antitoxin system prevent-host-death family antitoxin [Stellaceae bacterium]